MVWDANTLQTRQFIRRALALPARIEVDADHADQLRLGFADQNSRATVTDVSEGGLGLECSIFLPRPARLLVHVELESPGGKFEVVVRAAVRRCILADIKPTYHIGLQYLDSDTREIRELLTRGTQALCATADDTGGAPTP